MDRYIIKVLIYAHYVKFEKKKGFLSSLKKINLTLSFKEKEGQRFIRNV